MAKSAVNEQPVGVVLLVAGVVWDGLARQKGEQVTVPRETARDWEQRGWVRKAIRLRVRADNLPLFGHRACQMGEEVDAVSEAMALERWHAGHADILNPEVLSLPLPKQRKSEVGPDKLAQERAKLVAIRWVQHPDGRTRVFGGGLEWKNQVPGEIAYVSKATLTNLDKHTYELVEPPKAPTYVRVMGTEALTTRRVLVGNHIIRPGEVVDMPRDEYERVLQSPNGIACITPVDSTTALTNPPT